VRICIVYDCLYPYSIGGAERWYRNLAERLVHEGHDVTLLTLRQWERGAEPDIPGIRVVAAGPRMSLYSSSGRRRLLPPIVFGLGVLGHLLRRGRRYEVVHSASFPYFSLLAIAATRRLAGFRVVVDWHEVWTRDYWLEYLGPLGGRLGWRVQRRCLRVPQRAFCFSRLHERRLHDEGVRGDVVRLEGQYADAPGPEKPEPARPVAVFAGRLIPEKRATAVILAIARARDEIPELGGEIYGDGPERARVLQTISALGFEEVVAAFGFVDRAALDTALRSALCLVLPSRREGYGLVVLEAAAQGVPAVVVDEPDNAATELVEEGVNGAVAATASPDDLASALIRIHRAGPALRESTRAWFGDNAERLSLGRSLETVLAVYARG